MTAKDDTAPPGELILYQPGDRAPRIEVRLESGTVWLTQAQMAELYQTTVANINLHLKAIYAEGELAEAATIKPYLIVRPEGGRMVQHQVKHYNLEPQPVDRAFEDAVTRLKQLPPRKKS